MELLIEVKTGGHNISCKVTPLFKDFPDSTHLLDLNNEYQHTMTTECQFPSLFLLSLFFKKWLLTLLTFCLLLSKASLGQIPLYRWQPHFSSLPPVQMTHVNNQIWVSAQNMLYTVFPNGEIQTFTQYNGLNGDEVSRIVGIHQNNTLFVLYKNGRLDIIEDEEVIYTSQLLSSESITIYHHQIYGDKILLSSSVGLIVYHIATRQISDYVRIKADSGSLTIRNTWFHNHALWIIGDAGVYYLENLDANWQDIHQWKRVTIDNTGQNPEPIFTFSAYKDKKLYMGNASFLFEVEMNGFSIENTQLLDFTLSLETFKNIKFIEDKIIIFTNRNAYQWINSQEEILNFDLIDLSLLNKKKYGLSPSKGLVLIDDRLSNIIESFSPLSISANTSKVIISKGKKTIAISDYGFHIFDNRTWTNIARPSLTPTITYNPHKKIFITMSDKTLVALNEQNHLTTLETFSSLQGNIQKIEYLSDNQSLIILTDDINQPLYSIDFKLANLQLVNISLPNAGLTSTPFTDFLFYHHLIFFLSKGANGITVFNTQNNTMRQLSTANNQGKLPSRQVNVLSIDLNGALWVGTNQGVAYFLSSLQLGDDSIAANAILPVVDSAPLLRNEDINTITIDSANRKWIASKNGIWLFNPSGNQLLKRFTKSQDQLPSSHIKFMGYEEILGELFVQTTLGLVSVKIDVHAPKADYSSVRIFPNPVPKDYNSDVIIDGLQAGSTIKITDANLQVIYEDISGNNGSIVWDLTSKINSRINAGLYLVLITNGEETHTERIVVWR